MHVGNKNSHSTCDHQTLAEFQTKNLADLQIKYYRAAQAGINICCLYTLCFEISIASDVFKNNKLLFPQNTIWSTSEWNSALFLCGDMSSGTTKTKCYSAGEFYKAPPLPAVVCRVLVQLQLGQDTARLSCFSLERKDWTGTSVSLGRAVPVCITEGKTVRGWETCAAFSSENLGTDWLNGKVLTSVSSQAVVRGVSSVHVDQFV